MKKKKTKEHIHALEFIQKDITTLYLILMIGIFPLFFDNYYLNIVLAKKNFFQWMTGCLLLITMVFGIPIYFNKKGNSNNSEGISIPRVLSGGKKSSVYNQNNNKKVNNNACSGEKLKTRKFTISWTDIFVMFFGITILISCYISPVGKEAFWGNEVRKLGGLFFLMCTGAYFVVSRYYVPRKLLIWIFLLTNFLMCFMVVGQFWGFDLFDMYENLIVEQHLSFMGTMGNVNVNAGYFGIIVSLTLSFYYITKEKVLRYCFWGMSILGIYACYCTRSDSWLLSVGTAFFVLLFLSIKERETLKKWWMMCVAFWFGSAAIKLTEVIEANTSWESLFVKNIQSRKFIAFMISYKVLLVEIVLLLVFYFFIRSSYMVFFQKYGRKILVGFIGVMFLGIVAYIYPMEDSFGNFRGYIWKRTLINFKDFPIMQKLFGYGPNCFYQAMEKNYGAEMLEKFDAAFYDAHNEILQFLTVSGIFGMVSYMGMQIAALVSCFKKNDTFSVAILGCVVLTAYMMQGMVNNPQVFTTPLLFLFVGIMENKIRNNQSCLHEFDCYEGYDGTVIVK